MVTTPSEKDFKHPEIGKIIDKYLKGDPAYSTEERYRMLSLIHAMCFGVVAPSYHTESMHGAGSPEAQVIMIGRLGDLEAKKTLAKRLASIGTQSHTSD